MIKSNMSESSNSSWSNIPEVSHSMTGLDSSAPNPAGLEEEIEAQEKYTLPPRSNRGIPPKRYEPDYEPRKTKYPVANLVRGSISTKRKTFNTALYSTSIPKTVEEAQENE